MKFNKWSLFILLIFSFGIKNIGYANQNIVINDYRYEVAKKVFDDLVDAKSVRNMPVPLFKLVDTERNVAWSKKKIAEIGLEIKAYEICVSFGKDSLNALAAILGHEITHYYEKHGWTELFAAEHSEMNSAAEMMHTDEHLAQEIQADYLGGFLAYAAGYQATKIMPDFLEKVYQSYGFPEKMEGYPSLQERKKMAEESSEKSQMLANIFDFANYLTAAGELGTAKFYLEYILKDFQSRELYNNLGVVSTMAALDLFSKKELKYAYPLELDAESRLKDSKKGGTTDFASQKLQREKLLQEAVEHFKTAILLDENYAPGYLNLGCAYALLGEVDDAAYFANKAKKYAKKGKKSKTASDAIVLLGIIAIEIKDIEEANLLFDKAAKSGNELALLNQSILNGKFLSKEETTFQSTAPTKELLDGLSIDQVVHQLERDQLEPTAMKELDSKTVFAYLEKENSIVLIHLRPYAEEYFLIQLSKATCEKAPKKDVSCGASKADICAQYNTCGKLVELTNSSLQVFSKQQFLFKLNEQKIMEQWGVFRKSR